MKREMKRSDRQVTDQKEIDAIINRCQVCRLAMYDGEESYIVPMSFGYANKTVYFHGARVGRKIDILTAFPEVCVEFDRALDMVTDEETACRWSQKFESVIAWGRAELLSQAEEKREAFNIIMGHYADRKKWTYEDTLIARTEVIKIPLHRMTAKQFL
jgi:nitroimidazol reductase NimA-like FMN-containing flavoprotein (pyridoxamine 5'-phosphate oxidase superfamily)